MDVLTAAILLLGAPQGEKSAEELFKAFREKVETARTIRYENVGKLEYGEVSLATSSVLKIKGKDRWTWEYDTKPGRKGPRDHISICCDGRRFTVRGEGTVAPPEGTKPEKIVADLRKSLATAAWFRFPFFEEERNLPGPPVMSAVRDAGKEKVGGREARILEYTLKYGDFEISVRIFLDPLELRPLKREFVSSLSSQPGVPNSQSTETITAFALDEEIPDSEFALTSKKQLASATAGQLARSVALCAKFTGRFPRALEDLLRRPPGLDPEVFWPEGGCVRGGVLPKDPWGHAFELRDDGGSVSVACPGTDVTAPAGAASRKPVGAPTERLQKQYTARVRLHLLAAAVRAFCDTYGELPSKETALWAKPEGEDVWPEGGWLPGGKVPDDPWGKAYRIICDKDCVRVQVEDPQARLLRKKQLSTEERAKLEEAAQTRLTEEEKKEIGRLMGLLANDDIGTREKAHEALKRWGSSAEPLLDERLKVEKDAEALARLRALKNSLPRRPPAWAAELTMLSVTVRREPAKEAEEDDGDIASRERMAASCLKNLATAECDFKANDRDSNKVNDFWTGDVAGFFCMTSSATAGNADPPLKLIDGAIAAADGAPLKAGAAGGEYADISTFVVPGPKGGYYFRAMTRDRSADEDYAQDTGGVPTMGAVHNNSRFGFCAYPAEYGDSGNKTYIINEGNTLYWKDTQGEPILEWPADSNLKAGWNKLD